MLTAKDTTQIKSQVYAGADDYLVKPTDVLELLARVRIGRIVLWKAKLRRFTTAPAHPNC